MSATIGKSRSTKGRKPTAKRAKKKVSLDGSDDPNVIILSGPSVSSDSSDSSGESKATATLTKNKRTEPKAAKGDQPGVARGSQAAELHTQLHADARKATHSGLAARFAMLASRFSKGVTIGIDKNLDVRVISESQKVVDASPHGHPLNVVPIADGLDDPVLRDLDETVRRFMRGPAAEAAAAPARARFAAAVFGISAGDVTKVNAVADATLAALWERLNPKEAGGRQRPVHNEAFSKQFIALLNAAATTWTSASEADFWTSIAAASRPEGVSDEAFLHEQAAWMGLIASLSLDSLDPPWMWTSAAEKADLVDTLVQAAAGSQEPVAAVLRRLSTLTRGQDPLPRAIAAELAQLALAALGGVQPAAAPDRRGVVKLKERPPGPDATAAEQREHEVRDALRRVAHSLVDLERLTLGDPHRAALFRNKLSTLYVDMLEQLRQQPAEPGEPSGEERYHRLLEILGQTEPAVRAALDKWSEAIASDSTKPDDYVTKPEDYLTRARMVQTVLQDFLQKLEEAKDPADNTVLFSEADLEKSMVGDAVRSLAVEVGLEAGEILLGKLRPEADRFAGLRHKLKQTRDIEKRLTEERTLTGGRYKAVRIIRQKVTKIKPKPAWADSLMAAADAFDVANKTRPLDPAMLVATTNGLFAAGNQALTGAENLKSESDRQGVTDAVELMYTAVAELLEKARDPGDAADPFSPVAGQLRNAVQFRLPSPAPGVGLDAFWSDQKADALRSLPRAMRKPIEDAMNLGLSSELAKLSKLVTAGDPDATEAQTWTVLRILRAYRSAVLALPNDKAVAKAKLLAAIDGVNLSVEKLLPLPLPAMAQV